MYGVSRIDVCENTTLITYNKIPVDLHIIQEVFQRIAQLGVNIDMISQTFPVGGKMNISFTCPDDDMVKVLTITRELGAAHPQLSALVSGSNNKLRLYGEEMRTEPGVFAKVLAVLAELGVEPLQITTSEVEISLLVTSAGFEETRDALRAAFSL